MLKILQYIDRLLASHGRNDKIAKQVLAALVIVMLCTIVRSTLPFPILPYLLFLPGVLAAGLFFGRISGLVSSVLSTLSAVYFFLPPARGFEIQDFPQGVGVFLFFVIASGIALVCSTLRSTLLGLERRVAAEVQNRAVAEDALRQSQKMEAVGKLTSGLAHDLRNSTMAVSGSLELIGKNVERGTYEKVPRYLSTARHATQSITDLTTRLLAFSRKQTLEPKMIDACGLLMGIENMLRSTLPGIKIEIECSASWSVFADPGQLEAAILNLAINSRDAMPDGGTILITTTDRILNSEDAVERGLPPGQYVSIRVHDSGTGMSQETIDRAFEPFFTTKAIGQGTGLGLSQVYGFARQSGGNVKLHSQVGHGTRICLLLPAHQGPHEMPTPTRPPVVTKSSGETVLLVDDDLGVRLVIEETLLDLGYEVIMAEDGVEGLALLRSDLAIDYLISDVMMPRMDGPTMIKLARPSRPSLPILIITGYSADLLSETGLLDDRMSILSKPFQIDDLTNRIQTALAA